MRVPYTPTRGDPLPPPPVVHVLEELGHARALRGIVRFTRKDQFGPTETSVSQIFQNMENGVAFPHVLEDLGPAGALCCIARFT